MHHRLVLVTVSLLAAFPLPGWAQAPRRTAVVAPWFERLEDSQWIRLSGPGIARREGRVTERGAPS